MTRRISKRYLKPRWGFLSQTSTGKLQISGWMATELAEKYGTPVYIMVESEIRDRLKRFKKSFPYSRLRPQYASKNNTNLEILKIVREEGFDLDASSVGEIILGLLADFEPNQITFTNLYKTEQDISFAATIGVMAITADSYEELEKLDLVGEKIDKKIKIFIRINPLIELGKYTTKEHQYGIPITFAKKAIDYTIESKHLELVGFHFHGAYIHTPKIYSIAAKKLLKLASYCKERNVKIKYIDLGGGFPYDHNSKTEFTPEDMGKPFVKSFIRLIKKYGLATPVLIFEPGKFITANAGIGLVKIISKKQIARKKIIVTDGSTYGFLPDCIIYNAYYDILPATKMGRRRVHDYTIAGCTCDSIDIIGKKRWLPKLEVGDLLAIMDCGAYSNVMASNFNTLKRAPMIMIKESGAIKKIRRRDRYSEMFAPELDVLKIGDPNELKKYYNLARVNIDKLWGVIKKKKKKA